MTENNQSGEYKYARTRNRTIKDHIYYENEPGYFNVCSLPKSGENEAWLGSVAKGDAVNHFFDVINSIGEFLILNVFEDKKIINNRDLEEINDVFSTHGLKLSESSYFRFEALDLEMNSGATLKFAYNKKNNEVVGVFYPEKNKITTYDKADLKKMSDKNFDELFSSLLRLEKIVVNSANEMEQKLTEKMTTMFIWYFCMLLKMYFEYIIKKEGIMTENEIKNLEKDSKIGFYLDIFGFFILFPIVIFLCI